MSSPEAKSLLATQERPEIDDAIRTFATISENLMQGYQELAERAAHVENELQIRVAELAQVRSHLEATLRAIPTGVVVRDAAGQIVRINRAARMILEQVDHDFLRDPRPVGDGGEFETTARDGQRVVLHRASSGIASTSGELQGTVEVLDDRTDVTRLTERLFAADKVASLGTLAAGVAHEIRNPLNAVKGFAALLRRELPEGSRAHRWSSRIVDGASEADTIIEGMMSYASPQELRAEVIDTATMADSAIAGALPADGARELWRVVVRTEIPRVTGDSIKLRQALRNLVENAAQAQPGGGAIQVDLFRDGDADVIRVTDDGPGIPAELGARVLDPFFTTRADGTGLGLALTATIARLHGGDITIDRGRSDLKGAQISIRLPRIRARLTAVPSPTEKG